MSTSPRDLREEERVAVDNNAFGGLGGLPPWLKGFALCIKIFIFFALCKFYRFSMGVL